jgi:hypothetical protein
VANLSGTFLGIAFALVASAAGPSPAWSAEASASATLEEIVAADRFGWPARFVCKRVVGDRHPLSVVASGPAELNGRLVLAGVWPEDCRGGFELRSVHAQAGKLDKLIGRVVVGSDDEDGVGPVAER